MQGFELMLKAAGIDPQKMAEDAMSRFLPELEKFKGSVVDTIRAEVIEPMAESFGQHFAKVIEANNAAIMIKLESMDNVLKSLSPGYVPMSFINGELQVDPSKAEPDVLTNPDLPAGGAVDMASLDAARLANQGSVEDQAALAGSAGTAGSEAGSNGQAGAEASEAGAGSGEAVAGSGEAGEGQAADASSAAQEGV